jgi:WXG100 family type VII secretion target
LSDAFSVDPDAVADAVARMSEFVRHTESLVTEIDTLVTHLHGTWTGQAAAAHAEAHQHWSRGEAMMREALTQLTTAGTTAHHNYTGAMTTNLSMWS